jgi:uncharacterized membrane protein
MPSLATNCLIASGARELCIMEGIAVLLILLFAFILIGAIVAYVAMGRTTNLKRKVESYREIIANLSAALTSLTRRISILESVSARPGESKSPPDDIPKSPEAEEAPVTQSLAPTPTTTPSWMQTRPDNVVIHDKSDTHEPEEPQAAEPPEEIVESSVEPEIPEEPQAPQEPAAVEEPQAQAPPRFTPPPPLPKAAIADTEVSSTSTSTSDIKPASHYTDWTDFESAAGKRWLTWGGVIILFLSAAFFLDYAFKVGWIGPGIQVLMAVGVGVAMLALGEYFLHKDMRPLGRGLIGGGIMILYAALFAAYKPNVLYETPVIESQTLTFALMCVVTLVGMALAIRHDAISIAFLAVLGGMLTPVLASKGTDARDVLFSYILLLDLGVLGVAFYKKWRALDILAFVGTVALYGGWYVKFGIGAPVGPPLGWLATFWAVFAIVPVAYHLRYKTPLTIERLMISLMNATFGFAFAYQILVGRPGDLAWAAMVMSASYLTLGVLARLRSEDEKAMFGFISLSMMFLTLFVPLHFALNAITLAWLAEAVVLVYLGFLFDYRPVRVGGFITLLLGVARVVNVNFPVLIWQSDQLAAFANKNFWTMMCAPIAGCLLAIVHQGYRRKATGDDKSIQLICTIGSGLLALVIVSFELDRWFWVRDNMLAAYRQYLSNCALIVLWAVGATGFLAGAKSWMARPLRFTGLLPLGASLALAAFTFVINLDGPHTLAMNPLFGASLLACGVLWAYSLTWSDLQIKTGFTVCAGLVTLAMFSLELDRWFWTLENIPRAYLVYLHHCAISVLWGAGTLAFLAGAKHSSLARPFRITGMFPLAGAALLIGYTFTLNPGFQQMLFIDPRFGAAVFVCAVMWVHSLSWSDSEPKMGFSILTSYATVALICAEVIMWIYRMAPTWEVDPHYTSLWVAAMLLSACAIVYLGAGRIKRASGAYSSGLAPLIIAWLCGLQAYLLYGHDNMLMFLNTRFVAAMMTLLVVLAWAAITQRDRKTFDEPSGTVVPLYTWFTLSLLALLSMEPSGWLYRHTGDPSQATRIAQMSVTIVWGLYASSMLSLGFWRRIMPLRLAALALFGLTAVKLLLVDMANVGTIYRIISFFIMGVLMVAASYLYHKAEKQLKKSQQTSGGDPSSS